jgi:hypothetical protein
LAMPGLEQGGQRKGANKQDDDDGCRTRHDQR